MNSQKALGPKPPQRQSLLTQEDYEYEVDVPKMHLVPCRWEKSGWKYVQVDPKEHNFFNNQNRVNFHGVSQPRQQARRGSVQRNTFYNSGASAFRGVERRGSDTTYGRFFSESR